MNLTPWTPTDPHALALVQLVRRAEGKVLDVLRSGLRDDAGNAAPPVAGLGTVATGGAKKDRGALSHADTLASTMGAARAALERWLSPAMVSQVVERSGERARAASERHWSGQVSRAAGVSMATDTTPGRELLQAWIADNTARLQGLRNETIKRMRDDLETALLSGVRPSELAAQWERAGLPTLNGTLRGRATVIARHQLGLFATQLAEHQQRAIGVTRYMWDPMAGIPRKHDKVHLNRAGAVYGWDEPPPGGHPGERVGCRCRSVAVVDPGTLRRRLR